MYLRYFDYILELASRVFDETVIPSALCEETVNSFKNGIPLIDPSPVREKKARIEVGTSLPVHLSHALQKKNCIVTAECIAQTIYEGHLATGSPFFSISIGNQIFLNGIPHASFLLQHVEETIESHPQKGFLEKAYEADSCFLESYMKHIVERMKENAQFLNEWRAVIAPVVSENERMLFLLSLLSDDEFDLTRIHSHVPLKDNPEQMLLLVRSIANSSALDSTSLHSLSPYRKPASHRLLDKAVVSLEDLILNIRYHELQAFLRKRPELVWKEVYSSFCAVRSVWNDPWGRIALSGMIETGEMSRVRYLKKMISWVLAYWDAYFEILLSDHYNKELFVHVEE
jgi:hypothetical protein